VVQNGRFTGSPTETPNWTLDAGIGTSLDVGQPGASGATAMLVPSRLPGLLILCAYPSFVAANLHVGTAHPSPPLAAEPLSSSCFLCVPAKGTA
jgi:hypothetical protein